MAVPVTPPVSWSVGGRSVIGAYHVQIRIPNQDAIAWWPRDDVADSAVLAVADGHGAAQHFRSGIGAHVAVEVAGAALVEALANPAGFADAARVGALIGEIIARWRSQIQIDIAARPLSGPAPQVDGAEFLPYGTTLIAAAAGPFGVLALQIGDGDLLLGMADGSFLRPLPDDHGMIGEETYSLCQPDAAERARWHFHAAASAVDFVMLSSDGLAKSFDDAASLEAVATYWRGETVAAGLPAVLDRLAPWLSKVSSNGSGDDITLGLIVKASATANVAGDRSLNPPSPRPRVIAPPAQPRRRWRWI